MKRSWFWLLGSLVLAGCGGLGATRSVTVTGRITDTNGNPIRGAEVRANDGVKTVSSTNGAYVLTSVLSNDQNIYAEYVDDAGVKYQGQNLAIVTKGEQTISVNMMVAPSSQLAEVTGYVEDPYGQRLSGARVFAYGGGAYSSTSAITNSQGRFVLRGLIAGIDYDLNASAPGYAADFDSITLTAGQSASRLLTLGVIGSPVLPAPTGLTALAWTSSAANRADHRQGAATRAIKELFDPKYKARHPESRVTPSGQPIEVELEWTPLQGNNFLGYGIYRGSGSNTIAGLDYWREPLGGAYVDGDQNLNENATYRYQITALGTGYPDDPGSEGPRSAIVTAQTLGELFLHQVQLGPVRFSWDTTSGATSYVVYVFNQYPGPGVSSIWNNSGSPATGGSLTYGGSALTSGRTYYFVVLGLANSNSSRTISEVGSFVQP